MNKRIPLPSQEELHALFKYEDGKLFRKKGCGPVKAGDEAGRVNSNGYKQASVNGKEYYQHRLIWIMHGNEPIDCLDHIDGDRLNNRIENLRPATKSENRWNEKLRNNNTSGIKGVYWNKYHKQWRGQVAFKRKIYTTSYFNDKQECAQAVRELREKLHGEFTNHG